MGERWQQLTQEEKEPYETQATSAKETFHRDMAVYKTTEAYRDYQKYLADFKAKHGSRPGNFKSPLVEKLKFTPKSDENQPSRLNHEQSTPSSASVGSGIEGQDLTLPSRNEKQYSMDGTDSVAPRSASGIRHSLSGALSRPSSISARSVTKDSSSSPVSPPVHPFAFNKTSSNRQTRLLEGEEEPWHSTRAGQQVVPNLSTYDARSPLSSGLGGSPYDASLFRSRRTPLAANERTPSFGREDSSKSSIGSSQSSISTAATSLFTPRGSEDDVRQHVTLPPLSSVTGLSRESHLIGQYMARKDSVLSLSAASPFSAQKSLVPAQSSVTGMSFSVPLSTM